MKIIPRKFWRNINDISGLGKSKNRQSIGKIVDDEGKEYENQDAADFLNTYYTTAGPRLAEKFRNNWECDRSGIHVDTEFEFKRISERDVSKIVKEITISKSCSLPGLSTRLVKDAFEVIVPELTYLFNKCINLGDIPESWCLGSITPIPKTTVKSTNAKNWRPITQIPLPGKLLEKLIHAQLYSYFNENNILFKEQYGFRPGKSTSHAIFDVLKVLYENWNNRMYTGCIFVDFARAFETIDHEIFLKKLEAYGLQRTPLNFLKQYITNRMQTTTVNDHVSNKDRVTYGTAQGSVLGPLIYIIYVNDVLKLLSEEYNIFLYADDMLIMYQHVDKNDMIVGLQEKLDSIMKWCSYNKLTVNREKTKFMLVSHSKEDTVMPLKIENSVLSSVTHYEYLGMLLDSKLNMTQHVDNMYKKANSKLGILCKIRRYITENTAVRIYKTMIRPHLEYIDFVIDSCTKDRIEKIDKFENRALRRIEYCMKPEHRLDYAELRQKYKIEHLCVRRKRSLLRIMYDKSKDVKNIEVVSHDKNLRSRGKIKIRTKFSGLTKLHVSPYYRGSYLWSQLSADIQQSENRIIFQQKVKKEIM